MHEKDPDGKQPKAEHRLSRLNMQKVAAYPTQIGITAGIVGRKHQREGRQKTRAKSTQCQSAHKLSLLVRDAKMLARSCGKRRLTAVDHMFRQQECRSVP